MRVASFGFAMVLAVGCVSDDADPSDDAAHVGEIVIPMRPATETVLSVATEIVGTEVHLQGELALAVGEEYPPNLTGYLPEWGMLAECGPIVWSELELHEVSGATEAVAARVEGSAVHLSAHEVGVAELSIAGELTVRVDSGCPIAAGTTVPLALTLSVRALRPAGVRFEIPPGCGEAPVVAAGWHASDFHVAMLDDAGEVFLAANAASDAQTTVRLRGGFEPSRRVPTTTLGSWSTPTEPGTVEIESELDGSSLSLDVVDAAAITRAEIEFQLSGTLGDPTVLHDDVVYGDDGWEDGTNRIAAVAHALWVSDRPLCSSPPASWFQLESLTPDVCTVLESDHAKLPIGFSGRETGARARLETDGLCSLVLRTPDFADSAGRTRSLSATFRNVHELYE